ncbi:dienelactone hydrolase family protein [Streptomyces ureilyticus]|uniref:Dienelactone hydrolase family protein n=1 Tax=Streptomyces ureilyticus TaxID=1775131 RepID=A0ABX0DIW7_9ACTN|nr:dienelactone hydrolase family protein [Streptomyces ureilyticus]NGO41801.1 dienelactone hydrolase family protein [Streptomyces ureilyticus]
MISDLVLVPASGAPLAGDLVVPGPVRSVVVITEGSSSSRGSSRDRTLADTFHRAGMGTLLLDLLTELEKRADARAARHLFDIPFLAQRLVDAIDWLDQRPETAGVPVCLFGGDSSALLAAAERPQRVSAVVIRGGRPDLTYDALRSVRAPVLFVVGGADETDPRTNQEAPGRLSAPSEIHVVRGATHLFHEPGALEDISAAARQWFASHVESGPRAGTGR